MKTGSRALAGERKSNASTYLPTIFGLSAAGAAGEAMSQGQYTTQNNVNGISATMTGDAGQAALGKPFPAACLKPPTGSNSVTG